MKKKWSIKVDGKIVKHEQVGARIGKPGSPKQKSYCKRNLGEEEYLLYEKIKQLNKKGVKP